MPGDVLALLGQVLGDARPHPPRTARGVWPSSAGTRRRRPCRRPAKLRVVDRAADRRPADHLPDLADGEGVERLGEPVGRDAAGREAAQSIMCWRARPTARWSGWARSPGSPALPFISWPPIVMKREYQSTRNSETSLAPIIDVPDTSPWLQRLGVGEVVLPGRRHGEPGLFVEVGPVEHDHRAAVDARDEEQVVAAELPSLDVEVAAVLELAGREVREVVAPGVLHGSRRSRSSG